MYLTRNISLIVTYSILQNKEVYNEICAYMRGCPIKGRLHFVICIFESEISFFISLSAFLKFYFNVYYNPLAEYYQTPQTSCKYDLGYAASTSTVSANVLRAIFHSFWITFGFYANDLMYTQKLVTMYNFRCLYQNPCIIKSYLHWL